ncbi:hypothetical protein ACB092_11G049300 [Castanea dentata]
MDSNQAMTKVSDPNVLTGTALWLWSAPMLQFEDNELLNLFNLPVQTITLEIEKDLRLLKLRSAIIQRGTTRRVIQNPKCCPSISRLGW